MPTERIKRGFYQKFSALALAMDRHLKEHPFLFALVISSAFILVSYPSLCFFRRFVMAVGFGTVQDPVVSRFTFIPGVRSLRFELLNHFNYLWSNLRGNGMPLLGFEVQAAPLFPLTLLLVWLPEKIFWNLFVLLRMVGIGTACVLIGLHILGLKRLGAAIFMFCFAYSLYVLRWINHPWQNGFLAGLWYLYFLVRLTEFGQDVFARRAPFVLGLSASVYGLLTCGFPEAAALGGLLTVLVALPFVLVRCYRPASALRYFSDLGFSHVIGFALAGPQFFSLVEFVASEGPKYRQGIGLYQFSSLSVLLGMGTCFSSQPSFNSLALHTFHLIPIFLFLWGIQSRLRSRVWGLADISAVICFTFALLKLFPIWPGFNSLIASLPILNSSWFIVYFLPLLIWPVAYFAAVGGESLCGPEPLRENRVLFWLFLALIFAIVVSEVHQREDIIPLRAIKLVGFFLLFTFLVAQKVFSRYVLSDGKRALCLILLIVSEILTVRGQGFGDFGEVDRAKERGNEIVRDLGGKGISPNDYRADQTISDATEVGIATVDLGAPAIINARQRNLRLKLFNMLDDNILGAYLPIDSLKVPYALQLTSSAFSLNQGTFVFDRSALSRAYIPSKCHLSSNSEDSLSAISDPARFHLGEVWLENLSGDEIWTCRNFSSSLKKVSILSDEGSRVRISSVKGPTILVLNDNWFSGWRAIDRTSEDEFTIKPANLGFRAVILPDKREYEIEFVYRPPWLIFSLLLVALGLVSAIGLIMISIGYSPSRSVVIPRTEPELI